MVGARGRRWPRGAPWGLTDGFVRATSKPRPDIKVPGSKQKDLPHEGHGLELHRSAQEEDGVFDIGGKEGDDGGKELRKGGIVLCDWCGRMEVERLAQIDKSAAGGEAELRDLIGGEGGM